MRAVVWPSTAAGPSPSRWSSVAPALDADARASRRGDVVCTLAAAGAGICTTRRATSLASRSAESWGDDTCRLAHCTRPVSLTPPRNDCVVNAVAAGASWRLRVGLSMADMASVLRLQRRALLAGLAVLALQGLLQLARADGACTLDCQQGRVQRRVADLP